MTRLTRILGSKRLFTPRTEWVEPRVGRAIVLFSVHPLSEQVDPQAWHLVTPVTHGQRITATVAIRSCSRRDIIMKREMLRRLNQHPPTSEFVPKVHPAEQDSDDYDDDEESDEDEDDLGHKDLDDEEDDDDEYYFDDVDFDDEDYYEDDEDDEDEDDEDEDDFDDEDDEDDLNDEDDSDDDSDDDYDEEENLNDKDNFDGKSAFDDADGFNYKKEMGGENNSNIAVTEQHSEDETDYLEDRDGGNDNDPTANGNEEEKGCVDRDLSDGSETTGPDSCETERWAKQWTQSIP